MKREKLPLSSDQLELLLAFEASGSLSAVATVLARDPSVISRNLQRMAEVLPVLKKHRGRWQVTPLGRQINSMTRAYLAELVRIIPRPAQGQKRATLPHASSRALLLVVNAQLALQEPETGKRNNRDAEKNIRRILDHWRKRSKPIVHLRHVSDRPESAYFRKARTSQFIPLLAPTKKETVIEKKKASAFAGTGLVEKLRSEKIETLVIVGFTANECIDATAKQASDLGFTSFVVGDATATFDVEGPDGRILRADRMHRLVLANLHAMFARVLETDALLRDLNSSRG